jgi:hypothetical protein
MTASERNPFANPLDGMEKSPIQGGPTPEPGMITRHQSAGGRGARGDLANLGTGRRRDSAASGPDLPEAALNSRARARGVGAQPREFTRPGLGLSRNYGNRSGVPMLVMQA